MSLTRLARLACSPSLDCVQTQTVTQTGLFRASTSHTLKCLAPSRLASNLEVIEDHLSELLHRCASGGLVEHRGLPARLWLLPQLIVHDLAELTADDPVVVSPASCVHLTSGAISPPQHFTKKIQRQGEPDASYLVVGQR